MISKNTKVTARHGQWVAFFMGSYFHILLGFHCCWMPGAVSTLLAVETNAAAHFNVQAYVIEDRTLLPTNTPAPILSRYTGTNVSLEDMASAAADLQAAYRQRGFPTVGVAIGQPEISSGVVTIRVFQGVFSQILISGKRYFNSGNEMAIAPNLLIANPAIPPRPTGADTTLAKPAAAKASSGKETPVAIRPMTPVKEALRRKMAELNAADREASAPPVDNTPSKIQLILAPTVTSSAINPPEALRRRMTELDLQERRARLFPNAATNSPASATNGQTFEVKGYELVGNTLLSSNLTELIFQPYIGLQISFDLIRRALADLQTVYHDRGFATVSVALPPQKLTNSIVKIRVFEGRLSEIIIANNRYFSSNNVMRALPSLNRGMILTSPIFQTELDRANANQDRQIYPQLEPGREEKTTLLRLNIKDQLPLHAKVEFNNQSSPGTPDLRVNSSAVYNNLWQQEHSIGVQHSFSPEAYKSGDQWNFYDRPAVVNYSGFYRLPLGNLDAIADTITAQPGSFGYNEATRKFNLPPPSGRPELNFFASRATIDNGTATTFSGNLYNTNGNSLDRRDVQQDVTKNNSFGARLSIPLPATDTQQAGFSGGFDYKIYDLASHKTNIFILNSLVIDNTSGRPQTNKNTSIISSPVGANGVTITHLEYLPLSFRYDASWRDSLGTTALGVGLSGNAWCSGSLKNLQAITGSAKSLGHWLILTPSISRDFAIHTNWTLSLHAEAQWASEPLISNEQFGAGGIGSVRGYREGEVFGDNGWRANFELKTPPHLVGTAYGREPLTVRGLAFTDYAQTSLLDPQGRPGSVSLLGVGVGAVAAVGSHWDARLLFSWPLLKTSSTVPGQPRFNFALTGQF